MIIIIIIIIIIITQKVIVIYHHKDKGRGGLLDWIHESCSVDFAISSFDINRISKEYQKNVKLISCKYLEKIRTASRDYQQKNKRKM